MCNNTERLLYQYQNSPQLRNFMLAFQREYCVLEDTALSLQTRLDIDLSVGKQLDLIGEIVGQPRPKVYVTVEGEIFGFDPLAVGDGGFPSGDVPDFGWSAVGRPDRGGAFGNTTGTVLAGDMLDLDYRTLLRARIFSNRANPTVDSISEFLTFALGPGNYEVVNDVTGQVTLLVDKFLSPVEEQIIFSLAPVAAGIRINDILTPSHWLTPGLFSSNSIGFSSSRGKLEPSTLGGQQINTLVHDPSNQRTLLWFTPMVQIPGVTVVTLEFYAGPTNTLNWVGVNNRYQSSTGLTATTAYLQSRVGALIGINMTMA